MVKVKTNGYYLVCKHKITTISAIYTNLSLIDRAKFIKWKYTVGHGGARTYCWECYKHGLHQEG